MNKKIIEHIVVRKERSFMGRAKCSDYTGKSSGYLTVSEQVGFNYRDVSVYLVKDIFGEEVTLGVSVIRRKSFGNRFYHKKSVLKNKHLNSVYFCMIRRCYDNTHNFYKYYGGKGIVVCDEWLGENGRRKFIIWAANTGYTIGLTLDRTNNDIGYTPDNCSWMLHKDNVRKSSSAVLNIEKVKQIRKEFSSLKRGERILFFNTIAKQTGVSFGTIKQLCYNNRLWN